MVFFIVLEILADELDIYKPGICEISFKKLRKNCQISAKKLAKILRFFDEKAKKNAHLELSFEVDFNDTHITIKCPKFKKLCDDYTRKKLAIIESKSPDIGGRLSSRVPARQQIKTKIKNKVITTGAEKNIDAGLFFKNKNMGGLSNLIIEKCEQIEILNQESDHKFNIYSWTQDKINRNGHPSAILEVLDLFIIRWKKILSPWAYGQAMFELKNGNYWETEHIKQAEKFKLHWVSDDKVKTLIEGIGNGINSKDEKICF
jgi:hypothetical protein